MPNSWRRLAAPKGISFLSLYSTVLCPFSPDFTLTVFIPFASSTYVNNTWCGEHPYKHTRKSSSSSHPSIQFLMVASLNTVNHGTPARRTFQSSPKPLRSSTILYHLQSNRRLTPILVCSIILALSRFQSHTANHAPRTINAPITDVEIRKHRTTPFKSTF